MLATLVFFALPVSLFFVPGLLLDLLEVFILFFWILMTRNPPLKADVTSRTLLQCTANAKRLLSARDPVHPQKTIWISPPAAYSAGCRWLRF
jgi:hypothetical protein